MENTNSNLHMSPLGISLLQAFEKCKLKAYNDGSGVWTIGWGCTRYQSGHAVQEGDTITQLQADQQLLHDLLHFETIVQHKISGELRQHEFDSLTDFAYNTGGGYKDKNLVYHDYDLWHNINEGMTGDALHNYWINCAVTAGGVKMAGLIRRRKAQVYLFQTSTVNTFE